MTANPAKKIKDSLIENIKLTNDLHFLSEMQAVYELYHNDFEDLPAFLKEKIKKGKNDIAEGKVMPHKIAMNEIKSWLRKK